MSKRTAWLAGISILALLLVIGCSKAAEEAAPTDVEAADAVALTYVQGAVEGDDDLLRTVLSPEDSHYRNLQDGRHNIPNGFEQIGERYSIYRFNKEPDANGQLYYKVSFQLIKLDKYFTEFLRMEKVDNAWKIREIDSEEAEASVPQPLETITVHEGKEE